METVNAQLAALGDAPTGEATEAADLAELRASLTETLASLTAPAARAGAAYALADGLIKEIDAIIRDRQAAQFLERSATPLNPATWTIAWDNWTAGLRATRGELETALSSPGQRQQVVGNLPVALVLTAVAVVLLLRGRRWMRWLEARVRTVTQRGQGVWTFLLSLGQIVLPFAGIAILAIAFLSTGIEGRRITALVTALPFYGLNPIIAHWLGGHLLTPGPDAGTGVFGLTTESRGRLKRRFIWLGYLLMLASLMVLWTEVNGIAGTSAAVLQFPFGVAVAIALFQIGRVMLLGGVADEAQDEAETIRPFRERVLSLVGRLLILGAALGVALAALGFVAAFEMIVFPLAGTLYLLGALVLSQRLAFDLYALIAGEDDKGGAGGLVPVSIAFLLTLAALPLLALLWGARTTDLTELWARFQEGFDIGGTVISPGNFLTFVIVFVVGYSAVRLLQTALKTSVLPRTRMDIGGQNAVSAGVGYVGMFLAAVVAITMAGIDLTGLALVAGALSVGIGFGLQNIVSNFVSGIILLIERPISEGDWIEVGGQMGYVRSISVRSTRIETFDRTDVIVPNADLVSGTVTNYTRGNSVGRLIVSVGVAYGTDTHQVSAILQEIAEAHPMVILNPKPLVVFQGFGADSLDFEIRAILRDVNWIMSVKTEINHEINRRFTEEGIEIPFAQRDVWLRNPESLRSGAVATPPTPDPGPASDAAPVDPDGEPE